MLGLLVKDLYMLKHYSKSALVVLAVFALVFGLIGNGAANFMGVSIIICAMLASTSMGYDSWAKWDMYALTTPVTRKEMVLSKYILLLTLALLGALVGVVVLLLLSLWGQTWQAGEILGAMALGLIFALFIASIMFPLLYQYGVEKAGILMNIGFALPLLFFFLGRNVWGQIIMELPWGLLLGLGLILALVMYGISYHLAVHIYAKKDL